MKVFFQDARISPPKNPSDVVLKLTQKSLIMPVEENRRYCITQTGMEFVEKMDAETKKTKRKNPKAKVSYSKQISSFSTYSADDLHLCNYPDVYSISNIKEQMMLSLYIVQNEGLGDSFSAYDVQTIMTDILGIKATIGQIQGAFDRNKTWFKTEKDAENKRVVKHKLLKAAIEFGKVLST